MKKRWINLLIIMGVVIACLTACGGKTRSRRPEAPSIVNNEENYQVWSSLKPNDQKILIQEIMEDEMGFKTIIEYLGKDNPEMARIIPNCIANYQDAELVETIRANALDEKKSREETAKKMAADTEKISEQGIEQDNTLEQSTAVDKTEEKKEEKNNENKQKETDKKIQVIGREKEVKTNIFSSIQNEKRDYLLEKSLTSKNGKARVKEIKETAKQEARPIGIYIALIIFIVISIAEGAMVVYMLNQIKAIKKSRRIPRKVRKEEQIEGVMESNLKSKLENSPVREERENSVVLFPVKETEILETPQKKSNDFSIFDKKPEVFAPVEKIPKPEIPVVREPEIISYCAPTEDSIKSANMNLNLEFSLRSGISKDIAPYVLYSDNSIDFYREYYNNNGGGRRDNSRVWRQMLEGGNVQVLQCFDITTSFGTPVLTVEEAIGKQMTVTKRAKLNPNMTVKAKGQIVLN